MNASDDRRRFWRAAFRAEVRLVGSAGTSFAELLDISLNGALVDVPAGWSGKIGDACWLELGLADDTTIVMEVTVAHIEGRRVGLSCKNIDIDSITHLRRLVELNAGDQALLDREFAALIR